MLGIIAVGVSASIFITDSDMGEVGDETVGIPCGDASYDSGDSVDGSIVTFRGVLGFASLEEATLDANRAVSVSFSLSGLICRCEVTSLRVTRWASLFRSKRLEDLTRGLYPARAYSSGNAFRNRSRTSVELRRFLNAG